MWEGEGQKNITSHSLLTYYYDALCLTLFLILFIYLSCFEKKWKVMREEEGQKIAHRLIIKNECKNYVQKLYVKGKNVCKKKKCM